MRAEDGPDAVAPACCDVGLERPERDWDGDLDALRGVSARRGRGGRTYVVRREDAREKGLWVGREVEEAHDARAGGDKGCC